MALRDHLRAGRLCRIAGLITVVVCEEKHIFFTFIGIYTPTA
jgi:hypothetical protein